MRRSFGHVPVAASVIFLAAILPVHSVAARATPPAIFFENETCDLGSIVQGEQPSCVFVFRNRGDEDLRILQVEPSCGCTTTLLTAPVLHAAARGEIRAVFDSENFSGEVVKEVEVRSNDPSRPSVVLRVMALVEPEIDFEPRTATFDYLRPGAAVKQVVTLTNRSAGPVRILRLDVEPAAYSCVVPSWTDRAAPLALESWDRLPVEVRFTTPANFVMPVAGVCDFVIEGPRKRRFTLKLLALPAR